MCDNIINVYIYEPGKSIFKGSNNDKSSCTIITCSNKENCDLFKKNQCIMLKLFDKGCPYGGFYKETGFTRRAGKYHSWISERKKKYEQYLNSLESPGNAMSIVGEFVYLPYSYITMNNSVPFKLHDGIMTSGISLIHINDFTIENIVNICEFRPRPIFGYKEIKEYQEKEIPKFIKHLSERFPNLYSELCERLPRIKEISLSNIGRKAYIKTLNPYIGEFTDIHGGKWRWDGEYLISTNSKASFMLTNKFDEIKIKPQKDSFAIITDDLQVNKDTEFYKS